MRKVLCLLLCCVFCFMIIAVPASQPAKAVVVSTVIIGTVIAAMAAAGIGLTVSGMTSSQLSGWVSDKLSSWASSLGGSVEDHINGNLITTTASGIISIGTSAANSIAQFLGWLQTDEGLQDNDTVIVSSTGATPLAVINFEPTINDLPIVGTYLGPDFYALVYDPTLSSAAICCYRDDYHRSVMIYAGSKSSQMVCYFGGSSLNRRYPSYNQNHGIYETNVINVGYNELNMNMAYFNSLEECLTALEDYLNGDSESLSIDTGVITIPTIDTTTQDKWFIDVGAAPGTTIQTATDGVIADTIDGDLTVSGEVAESEPEFEITGPVAVTGITEVFPFCIPFDLAAFATCLVADPVCPHFEIPFVIPGLVDYTFVIDLSAFETVAQILRSMELLLFCVGLAFVTRKLLRS